MHVDPPLDALFLPFDDGLLPPPQGAAFLGARPGPPLRRWAACAIACEQEFRPTADALARSGEQVVDDELAPPAAFPTVLVLPPRQREQARALLARAVRLTAPGGRVVIAAANNAGARSMQDDFEALVGPAAVLSKYKCRVAWAAPAAGATDEARIDEWLAFDAPRPILGGGALSRAGLFAWDRVDPASALLAENLPTNLVGHAADLGAGWGYLTLELLRRNPGITVLDAYEARRRAMPVLEANVAPLRGKVDIRTHWADVTAGIEGKVDVVVSNPPFHAEDRADRPDLGQRFVQVAASMLRPGGRLWMVANRHLPYEEHLGAVFRNVRTAASARGFKVFEATR